MPVILSTLKNACSSDCKTYKVYKNFDDLPIGEYKINRFALVETKYGQRIRVTLDECYIYLPTRLLKTINEQSQIDELNSVGCIMVYKGKDKNSIQLDFKEVDDSESEDSDDESGNNNEGESEQEHVQDSQTKYAVTDYNDREKKLEAEARNKKHKKFEGRDEVDEAKPKKAKRITGLTRLERLERQAREFTLKQHPNYHELKEIYDVQDRAIARGRARDALKKQNKN